MVAGIQHQDVQEVRREVEGGIHQGGDRCRHQPHSCGPPSLQPQAYALLTVRTPLGRHDDADLLGVASVLTCNASQLVLQGQGEEILCRDGLTGNEQWGFVADARQVGPHSGIRIRVEGLLGLLAQQHSPVGTEGERLQAQITDGLEPGTGSILDEASAERTCLDGNPVGPTLDGIYWLVHVHNPPQGFTNRARVASAQAATPIMTHPGTLIIGETQIRRAG